jgi:pimeloyl-ACP methyl ester carboxylesterase
MWQPQVEHLGDYHCLVPDLPEHGRSVSEGPFSIKYAAALVHNLIQDRAHGGRANVIGLSLGGQVAVELLSQYPDVVDHAIVSGTLVRPIPMIRPLTPLIRAVLWCYEPFKNQDFWIRSNMKGYSIPMEYEAYFREDTRLTTPDSLSRLLVESMNYRLPSRLGRVTSPTLVVVGQKELRITYQSARDLVAAIPAAQGKVALNVGHSWNLEAHVLFTQMLRAWIEDQPLPRELIPFNLN